MSASEKLGAQFATVINAKLVELGMSQADLAREMGVTPKHINQMLTGKATGSPGMLDYCAHVLGFEWSVTASPAAPTEETPQTAELGFDSSKSKSRRGVSVPRKRGAQR